MAHWDRGQQTKATTSSEQNSSKHVPVNNGFKWESIKGINQKTVGGRMDQTNKQT